MNTWRRGFTIAELLVVIVVVAVLATVVAISYTGAQSRANNTKVRDAADKIADAIRVFAAREGHFPIGGNSSTAAIGVGKECADGVNGWYNVQYACTINDTLVASGYLPSDVAAGLPTNTNTTASPKSSVMVYKYGTNQAMVYYSLESPTTQDISDFNAQLTKCGLNPAGTIVQRDTHGMRGGICIDY